MKKSALYRIAVILLVLFCLLPACKEPDNKTPSITPGITISLNKKALNITVGNAETLVPTIYVPENYPKDITWTSSNPAVAGVDSNGTITALNPGTAQITATAVAANKTAICVVTVVPLSGQGITLSQTGAHAFPIAIVGYEAQTPLIVTLTNTTSQPSGALTFDCMGADAESFTLSPPSISSIAAGGNAVFTVTPKTGLDAGTYITTVTISVGNGIYAAFNVSFTVIPASGGTDPDDPDVNLTLSQTDTHMFPVAGVGYQAQTPLDVWITNTGSQASGPATVACMGVDADSFTLPWSSINSIDAGARVVFTVTPRTGLGAGTYIAAVTVSAGNGIFAAFNVSFTVTPLLDGSITLSQTGAYTFCPQTVGYKSTETLQVWITNTTSQTVGPVTYAFLGEDAGCFNIGTRSVSLPPGDSIFPVSPKTGLGAGTYTATLTVSLDNNAITAFNVSFTVVPVSDGIITLNQTGTYTFPSAVAGYGVQTPLNVRVTNNGSQPSGALTFACVGADADSFTLSPPSINSIAAGANTVFTVTPKTGLSDGNKFDGEYSSKYYITSVTVSDELSIWPPLVSHLG